MVKKLYIVFAENSYCMLNNEYFGKGDNCVIGYHDPRKATHFTTRKEAVEFSQTFKRECKIEDVENHLKKFDEFNGVYRTLPLLNNKVNIKYDGEKHKPADVLKWWMKYKKLPENSVTSEVYGTWPKLYSTFTHLWDCVSYYNSKYTELYHTVQFRVPRESKFVGFKKELSKVLDFITYTKDDYKILPIFDHELSEYETRYLYYKSDTDCKIIGRHEIFKGTLEKCFETIQRSYYYD